MLFLLVPGTRIELVQSQGSRDFKSLASTCSATQAIKTFCWFDWIFSEKSELFTVMLMKYIAMCIETNGKKQGRYKYIFHESEAVSIKI